MPQASLRLLPSVDQLLQSDDALELAAVYGRPLVLQTIRDVMTAVRAGYGAGGLLPDADEIIARAKASLKSLTAPTLVPVINASGVILHTNLGRAPLSQAAVEAAAQAAAAYSNLEFDLRQGTRGSRQVHCETLITRVTGAEAALVVNNNAAAVLLALTALARRKRVIISRGQLIEIGGGFRVPEVMAQSGAKLVEIGTTNRVHPADFEAAFSEPAAFILRAHPSNFRITGFTSEPPLAELAEIAHRHGACLMDDLGSGALLDTARCGLTHEPTVQESLAAGSDVVCFSGDKLVGGPQSGILAGRRELIEKIRRHPLARALRADKLCLAALSATLLHYLKDEAERQIPVWQMICTPADHVRQRAEAWRTSLGTGRVQASESTVGGGSLPGETLPTYALALEVPHPQRFLDRLRTCQPPLIARVQDGLVLLDPRTVLPGQDEALISSLRMTLGI